MKTLLNKINDSLAALLIFALIFLFSFTAAFGQAGSRVVITGQIIAPRGNNEPAYACLVASNGEEMEVVVRSSGKFWINAPEAERYDLHFGQPGSISKEVVVDAHNAAKAVGAHKDRKIRFDVVLHEDDAEGGLCYGSPVGRITFHHSNGHMKVKHHYQLVPVGEAQVPVIASGAGEEQH